ncbi:lactonase family protein [Pseudomonas rubra]|uniref:Lactonase family protein n=1 Tax=Pseudomonas rubra TaxID=2942627 RepID=A0ABT5PCL6_9PSED|nr:lactonase family protein [Pseudomonas rubra]MDD1016048.1 lactonase family protein [Pseudomonas rubra]MDD1039181.1 lactonase family protein [Pseudomonas rubra]MDD1155151.1 lactonase family protein [Pseudomonas rubra]
MTRLLKSLLIASSMSLTLCAQAHDLLVGSYTAGSSEGIYRYRFNSDSGQIEPTPLQVLKSENPSWLTLSVDRRLLFAVNENGGGNGQVSSFAIAKDGSLKALNQVPSQGDEPTHSSLSHDQRYLFVANYGAQPAPGGSLSVLPVDRQGRLQASVQQYRHAPSGVDPQRQTGPHVHSVVSSDNGKYVFASDLGADKVFVYRYDGASPSQPLTAVEPVSLPPGSGPRHLLFDRDGKHAYLTLEMSAQVVAFDYRNGTLLELQRLPLTEQTDASAKAAGALHLSADGRFLYVSNRGTANELLVFAVDDKSGKLMQVQRRSVEGDHPREFTLDPTGRFLLVANQKSNQIVVLRRDPRTGLLGDTVQKLAQDAPSDLKFVN